MKTRGGGTWRGKRRKEGKEILPYKVVVKWGGLQEGVSRSAALDGGFGGKLCRVRQRGSFLEWHPWD